jgi:hypothetical protein
MWRLSVLPIEDGGAVRAQIEAGGESISIGSVIDGWRSSPEFREFWITSLRNIPFEAYCWEMPPLTRAMLGRPFESVFVENQSLKSLAADSGPFEEHFTADAAASGVAIFESLRADSVLIAPYPHAVDDVYTHLATFMRKAPPMQIDQLWFAVAEAVDSQLGEGPIWLSTAGLGVSWLHIRLDARPKYYRHKAYAKTGYWTNQ